MKEQSHETQKQKQGAHGYSHGAQKHTQDTHGHAPGKQESVHGTYGHAHGTQEHTHDTHSHVHSHGAHTHVHSHQETMRIRNRLARVIGHLESIKRMVEDERDCTEILIQLAAVKSAINNTGKVILKEHIKSCITTAIRENDVSELEALNQAIDSFLK